MNLRRFTYLGFLCLLILTTILRFGSRTSLSLAPTNVKDTLSTSQLSYFARLGTGNTGGDSAIKIQLSGNPSNTTSNLFIGDTIGIGISGANGLNKYTIKDIGNTALAQINIGLSAVNAANGLMVVATRSAIHTITFTPQNSALNYKWQFLLKATSRTGELYNDGIPDQQGFDIGSTVAGLGTSGPGTRLNVSDVFCPWGGSVASVGNTVVISGNSYHDFTCSFGGGTTPIGVATTIVIGGSISTSSQLSNPSAAINHVEGQANAAADIYTFYMRHLNDLGAVVDVDTMTGKIAVVESVRVTATIDPTLTFTIDATGLGAGNTACGNTLATNAANTTATSVAFGSLSLGAFNDLAQRISCVTNSANGYAVTVYQTGQMKNVNDGVTIPDTNCDGSCGVGTTGVWTSDNTHSEWGYSIQNIGASAVQFDYTPVFQATAFGNGPSQAQSVMFSGNTPQTTERAIMCYRLTASTTQEAGNYEGKLTYTATATF